METKYKNSKIYMLINNELPGLVYYGSTIEPLNVRLSKHRYESKTRNKSSKPLFAKGTPQIVLIEKYPCSSKAELNAREGTYHLSFDCINKNVAGRSDKDSKLNWRTNNIDKQLKKFNCDCGGKYIHQNVSTHKKCAKHIKYISSNQV